MNEIVKSAPADLYLKWDEIKMRNFLLGMLLVFATGHRPSVPTRVTIKEFKAGFVEDGRWVVKTNSTKTLRSHGAANMALMYEGLYEAVLKYIETFKNDREVTEHVFKNSGDGDARTRDCMTLIRVEFFKDAIFPQEVKFLNPNIWRHGWANWALEHPDSNVAKMGAKTMGHSETTRDSH